MSLQPLRRVSISTGTILRTVAILAALWVLWRVQNIILAIFIALLIAGVLYPLAVWAKAHRIPRGLAVIAAYFVLFGTVALLFALLIPVMLEEVRTFAGVHGGSLEWVSDLADTLKGLADRFALGDVRSGLSGLLNQLPRSLGNILNAIVAVFGGLASFLIVLVLSFYLIVEEGAVKGVFRYLVPVEHQEFATQLVWQVVDKLGHWLRGQVILSLIIGILYFIGFAIAGIPYALLLSLLGGLFEFIPYVGPFLAAIPVIFFAFSESPWKALVAIIIIVVVQQLENNVIVPKVMQRAIGLNPIVSILAVWAGWELFKVAGAIFSIPIATALSVAVPELLRYRRDQSR